MGCLIVGLTNKGERVDAQLSTPHTPIVSSLSSDFVPVASSVEPKYDAVLKAYFTPKPNAISGISFGMTCRIPIIITPTDTYTRLTYIECTGEQYINTDRKSVV